MGDKNDICDDPPSSTSHIFKKFQQLYAKQLKEANETSGSDGLKLKIKILENWVEDLTEQNVMLVKTVDELECEALKRLSMLEANITQEKETTLAEGTFGKNSNIPKGLHCQVEVLCRELEQVKKQLADKEKLISKYQTRINELGSTIEGENGEDCDRVFTHSFSRAGSICDQDRNVQPSVYRELESTRLQLTQVEKEVIQLKKKLKEAESNIKRLRSDLVASEKNAREMRAALTEEVADKHDQILALRREVNQLEDQLRQADMQVHFKDDIIKELRKEVKVARSKETLVEVLGIKERSLSHLEQLTEQLEQKNQVISCLKQQLTQGSSDLLYRVRQQVDWFTENVSQQCSKGNCSEEFKKCITTMLEELKESIECCNLSPVDSTELSKDSSKLVSTFQLFLEKSKKDVSQSWKSVSETVHQMNKTDSSALMDQLKVGLCKQKNLQQRLQEVVRTIFNITSHSNGNVEAISRSMDSLQALLCRFTNELKNQPAGRSFAVWLKNLHSVVTELISKIEQVSQIIGDVKSSDNRTHADLVCKIQIVERLQQELSEALRVEVKAYENLCRKEKAQRIQVDSLLASVLHHQETWKQQVCLTDDLMKEMLRLTNDSYLTKIYSKPSSSNPLEGRNTKLQTLVSKMSADIKESISNVEQRQNQVSHLELDLSSVKMALESAQHEIDDISKTCNTQDVIRKVTCLLLKLKKQITNALTKANDLVKAYASTKEEFLSSSVRICQLQQEWEVLEQEVRCRWEQISKDFNIPTKPEQGVFPNQAVLAICEKKSTIGPLLRQYKGDQRELEREADVAMKKVKGNVMDLKSNIKDRDKLTETQDKTICVLRNSLKRCQTEAEGLRKTVHCLEVQKCRIEVDSKRNIQELESKILKLQNCLKKYGEEDKIRQKTEEDLKLEVANLKENILKEQKMVCELQNKNQQLENRIENLKTSTNNESKMLEAEKEYRNKLEQLQNKICELQNKLKLSEEAAAKHHKSEAALQIVIATLKETICEERKKCSEIHKENSNLSEKVKQFEDSSKNVSRSNQETMDKISDLKKQVKCCSKQVADLQDQLTAAQEKLCKSLQHERELEVELSCKDCRHKEEICKKEEEIKELKNTVQCLTERVNESKTELNATKIKTCEAELKLQNACSAYEELKSKEREKEAQADKLQSALTELSKKFVSHRLDLGNTQSVRHYQEECAKYEALYKTTACKLCSKEMEVSSLKQELDRLRRELDHIAMTTSQQKEDESCPFLMERVHQLSKELQVAHSCQNSYETMLRDIREKYAKKEEENFLLKTQISQLTLQRDTIMSDLEIARQDINRLKNSNSSLQTTIKRLENNYAQYSEQLYENDHSPTSLLQPNIELQREISTELTSQLRGVKQKLHSTKHDYKLLQSAYEELNHKYKMLQRGERDMELIKETKPMPKNEFHCRPCSAKPSKSVMSTKPSETVVNKTRGLRGEDHVDYLSHSKSWHNEKEMDRRWKRKLQEAIRGSEAMYNSASSN